MPQIYSEGCRASLRFHFHGKLLVKLEHAYRQKWAEDRQGTKELAKGAFTADISPFFIRDYLGGYLGIQELFLEYSLVNVSISDPM